MASDSADRHQAGEGAEGGGASAADPTGAGVEDDIEEGEEGEGKGSSPAPTAAFRRFGLLPACISASRLRSAGTGAAAGETSGDGGGSALGEEDARRPPDEDECPASAGGSQWPPAVPPTPTGLPPHLAPGGTSFPSCFAGRPFRPVPAAGCDAAGGGGVQRACCDAAVTRPGCGASPTRLASTSGWAWG